MPGGQKPRQRRGALLRLHRSAVIAVRPQLCLRRLVLASSISLAPPQAAGLVHCAARPLQTANATLVCCLVPVLSCQKKVCKKEAQDAKIALTRRKTSRYIVRIVVPLSVDRTPFGRRPHKLHIPRFRASAKARPFRCSSFPKHKRFAGLCFGSLVLSCSRPLNI